MEIRSLRLRYFLIHLLISALVIGLFLALILFVWYPEGFASLESIYPILVIMAGVDVGIGPLCTLVAASPNKTRAHLARDLATIGVMQIVALGYAMYTTAIARPAFVVYAFGQFDVEHAAELPAEELAKASVREFSSAPMFGPVFVEARLPDDPAEAGRVINSTTRGDNALKDMPRYFRHWSAGAEDARKKAQPVAELPQDSPMRNAIFLRLQETGLTAADAITLPINSKITRGIVLLRRSDLSVLGIYAPPVP